MATKKASHAKPLANKKPAEEKPSAPTQSPALKKIVFQQAISEIQRTSANGHIIQKLQKCINTGKYDAAVATEAAQEVENRGTAGTAFLVADLRAVK